MVKVFASNPKVKRSNLIGGVVVVNNGMLIEYSPMKFPRIGA
jgi:hypothetical protein